MLNRLLATTVACYLYLAVTSAVAHHGGAVYNEAETVTVSGPVTEFKFVNPHVLISIAVTSENGEVVEWSGELTSPNRLARMAQPGSVRWHKDILQPGDVIELTGSPAASGAPALRLHRVVDATGTAIIGGNR
ncbi:MAG: DUF6152 family protein [Gammaproteobacteria bacterium]|nr:DUF6152 family protein [Gammaproteobacteria bacterium]MDH3508420.1 DUF6152 family protein [Gammaproteobacteria bacterium]